MSRLGKLLRSAAAAALTAIGVSPAAAQQTPTAPAPLPDVASFLTDNRVAPVGFGRSVRVDRGTPCPPAYQPYQPAPCYPAVPGEPPVTQPPVPPPPPTIDEGGFAGGGAADVGTTVGLAGYIENAAPVTMFRLRADFGYGMNRPDRAEFFYAKCGCFMTPDAKGPPLPETNIDYQELIPYLEVAFTKRFSAFVDIPTRYINPTANRNAAGLSDISFGGKYAFIYNERRIVSFLLRTTAPSGETFTGLGTGNWRIEPGLLWLEQLTCRFQLFGEIRDSIPLDRQSDFTGNVLRYGLGGSYMFPMGRWGYVAPVVETVGWTVLSGKEFVDPTVGAISASGATIVNAKFGVRIGFGEVKAGTPYPTRSDLYVGYGRSLTGATWYKDLLRLEYRFFF